MRPVRKGELRAAARRVAPRAPASERRAAHHAGAARWQNNRLLAIVDNWGFYMLLPVGLYLFLTHFKQRDDKPLCAPRPFPPISMLAMKALPFLGTAQSRVPPILLE